MKFFKNYTFLCGMPRAGNTIIGSIINSNKNIKMTAYSVLPYMINDLLLLKNCNSFKSFPDHKSFDNVLKNLFNNYYSDWDCEHILERGWWGTNLNLMALDNIFKDTKFVILWRPVLEVLGSFVKVNKKNFLKNEKDVRLYVNHIMKDNEAVGLPLKSIKNLIDKKRNYKIFNYNDFLKDSKTFITDLGNFIGVDIQLPKKINQFNINGMFYNDSAIGQEGLHTVSENLKYVNEENYKDYLPEDIINKYKGIEYELKS
jgi:hypothetical protein